MPLPKTLHRHARNSVSGASYNVRKLTFLHTGAILALLVVANLVNLVVSQRIADTGGLGGLGLRGVLSTVQTLVQTAAQFALPFLQAGMVCAAIAIAHRKEFTPSVLLGGFRNANRLLRYKLLETVIYLGSGLACFAIANQLFMMLPFSLPFFNLLSTIDETTVLTDAMLVQFTQAYIPAFVIFGILYGVIAVFFFYQYRMGLYLLLSKPNITATAALRGSWNRMKGRRLQMFRLDLSYWWYYLLDGLCTCLLYGEAVLALAGVELPLSQDGVFLVTLALYCLCQLALYTWMRGTVETAYIHGYDAIIGSSNYPQDSDI